MPPRNPQLKLLKAQPKAYGGELRNTRKGRAHGRPLATRDTMHLVLRSSKAKGEWSFKHPKNTPRVRAILKKFSEKYGVKILSSANVGNHLHLQIKLARRWTWNPFIRAVTAAIAMAVTGRSRWKKNAASEKFWDYRPFTRVVQGWRAILRLKDYIQINRLEGVGNPRTVAQWIVKNDFVNST